MIFSPHKIQIKLVYLVDQDYNLSYWISFLFLKYVYNV